MAACGRALSLPHPTVTASGLRVLHYTWICRNVYVGTCSSLSGRVAFLVLTAVLGREDPQRVEMNPQSVYSDMAMARKQQ